MPHASLVMGFRATGAGVLASCLVLTTGTTWYSTFDTLRDWRWECSVVSLVVWFVGMLSYSNVICYIVAVGGKDSVMKVSCLEYVHFWVISGFGSSGGLYLSYLSFYEVLN